MKVWSMMMAAVPWVACVQGEERSGHAAASFLVEPKAYHVGGETVVYLKLSIDEGWHSYWVNPGEGGMALKAVWTLPEGWKAGALEAPVPKRFMTGDLPGFGYEGEAIYRVRIQAPVGVADAVDWKVKLSWLTCNEGACVPGDVELSVKVGPGEVGEFPEEKEAAKKLPVAVEGVEGELSEEGGEVKVRVRGISLEGVQVFPATPEVVDPSAAMKPEKDGDGWLIRAKKNEYASGEAEALELVMAGGGLERPISVLAKKK